MDIYLTNVTVEVSIDSEAGVKWIPKQIEPRVLDLRAPVPKAFVYSKKGKGILV